MSVSRFDFSHRPRKGPYLCFTSASFHLRDHLPLLQPPQRFLKRAALLPFAPAQRFTHRLDGHLPARFGLRFSLQNPLCPTPRFLRSQPLHPFHSKPRRPQPHPSPHPPPALSHLRQMPSPPPGFALRLARAFRLSPPLLLRLFRPFALPHLPLS